MGILRNAVRALVFSPAIFPLYQKVRYRKERSALIERLHSGGDLLADLAPSAREEWQKRIDDVLACPDNQYIVRDPRAGQLVDGNLIMHNGIKVDPLGYYGSPILKMLRENRGVHEPQEERVFQEVLDSLPAGRKTMLEFGAYWAFYSLWFLGRFPGSDCFMVEPDPACLYSGKRNFELNRARGRFTRSFIGAGEDGAAGITSPDAFCLANGIELVDLLHADIQGAELDMLAGCERLLSQRKVGYLFISTHSNELHRDCLDLLRDRHGYALVASADCDESYSCDGILVMRAPDYGGIAHVEISKRQNPQRPGRG